MTNSDIPISEPRVNDTHNRHFYIVTLLQVGIPVILYATYITWAIRHGFARFLDQGHSVKSLTKNLKLSRIVLSPNFSNQQVEPEKLIDLSNKFSNGLRQSDKLPSENDNQQSEFQLKINDIYQNFHDTRSDSSEDSSSVNQAGKKNLNFVAKVKRR